MCKVQQTYVHRGSINIYIYIRINIRGTPNYECATSIVNLSHTFCEQILLRVRHLTKLYSVFISINGWTLGRWLIL